MDYRKVPFIKDGIYHLYNRGVEKRVIFTQPSDYIRFLDSLKYYSFNTRLRFADFKKLTTNEKRDFFKKEEKEVEILAYCLMPNHFHLLVKQLKDVGISKFMSKLSNSYTRSFNTKFDRVGPLLQGIFKSVYVEDDIQLMQVSRYIHLNPVKANLCKLPEQYPWSSYKEYVSEKEELCSLSIVGSYFNSAEDYMEFCMNCIEDSIINEALALEEF